MTITVTITRRDFLRQTGLAGGALVFGLSISPSLTAGAGLVHNLREGFPVAGIPFVRIKPNGDFVIVTHRTEMGQGIRPSLAAVLVDELEADWSRVTLQQAEADGDRYAILFPFSAPGEAPQYLITGEASQLTDSSHSMAMYFAPMRLFGAAIRLTMIRAAADKWGIPAKECWAEKHRVYGPGGRSSDYRWLLSRAARQTPTFDEIAANLKTPAEWRYIGGVKDPTPFYDANDMVRGRTVYAADLTFKGMLTAVIERCPVANGALASYDPVPALAVNGVRAVLPIFPAGARGGGVGRAYRPQAGIAVLATNTWAAIKGRKALRPTVVWDLGPHAAYDSEAYRSSLEESTGRPGQPVRHKGDIEPAFTKAVKTIEARYYVPHLAQVPMEPPVAVALFRDGRIEVWAPTQSPDITLQMVGSIALGYSDDFTADELQRRLVRLAATVHVTMAGGGFGRKLFPDFVIEAAILARLKPGVPIRVQWTREDDIRFSYYSAPSSQYLKAAFDEAGRTTALLWRSAFPSWMGTFFPNPSTPALTAQEIVTSSESRAAFPSGGTYPYASNIERGDGFDDMPYDIPNIRLENGPATNHVRIGCVRSGANVFHAFGICSFADEIAIAAGRDSKDYLLELIGKDRVLRLTDEGVARPSNNGFPMEQVVVPTAEGGTRPVIDGYPPETGRLRSVVERVAHDSGWDIKKGTLPKGRGLGVAAHRSRLSYVAIVADVSLDEYSVLTLHAIYAAIDCGLAVNRDRVFAQMEGGIIFGLNLALFGEITFTNGAVVQKDFDDYPMLRMRGLPKITVSIIESTKPPTGAGEPPVPAVAPALANAIVAAGGPRIREFPFSKYVDVRSLAGQNA